MNISWETAKELIKSADSLISDDDWHSGFRKIKESVIAWIQYDPDAVIINKENVIDITLKESTITFEVKKDTFIYYKSVTLCFVNKNLSDTAKMMEEKNSFKS